MCRSAGRPATAGSPSLKTVAIIGAGFSGTTLAASLLERSEEAIRVLLFDRTGEFGSGVAYRSDEPFHFLNVGAAKMSAFEDRPSHFRDWLFKRKIEASDGFSARIHYRGYLHSLLGEAPRNGQSELRKLSQSVVALEGERDLVTDTGLRYSADAIVLATGYLSETTSGLCGVRPALDTASWPQKGVRRVVVVGSSLTALDAAASAFSRYPGATVTLVSRHGFVPEPFDLSPTPHVLSGPPPVRNVRSIVGWLRAEILLAEQRGAGWTSVFDALRPQWESLWQSLPDEERRRFLRHLVRWFDRYRHRVPPALHALLAPRWRSGALTAQKGKVVEASQAGVTLADGSRLAADLVLDASGFSSNWTTTLEPLAMSLLAGGRIRPGSIGLGIFADSTGRVTENFYAIGPPLKGDRWETTAVPEIRRQVSTVCDAILGNR